MGVRLCNRDGQGVGSVHWPLAGRHNVENALGVIAVAAHRGRLAHVFRREAPARSGGLRARHLPHAGKCCGLH